MSPPAGFDEKTADFDGKMFGFSVPAPGEDMASPLRVHTIKQPDKREFVEPVVIRSLSLQARAPSSAVGYKYP